ncbi:hypothetical protein LJC61_04865 [Ruminococcaceae bacterium OttesenSCG-928-A16]|nr:hypothetical protein [Ruminococcaceae bacterium OttesenSCG-928-A16]
MAPKKRLFGNSITPACIYCQFGRPSPDGIMVLCKKFGPVSPYYSCKKYIYNPIKRVPRKAPKLPSFSPEDFDIY